MEQVLDDDDDDNSAGQSPEIMVTGICDKSRIHSEGERWFDKTPLVAITYKQRLPKGCDKTNRNNYIKHCSIYL